MLEETLGEVETTIRTSRAFIGDGCLSGLAQTTDGNCPPTIATTAVLRSVESYNIVIGPVIVPTSSQPIGKVRRMPRKPLGMLMLSRPLGLRPVSYGSIDAIPVSKIPAVDSGEDGEGEGEDECEWGHFSSTIRGWREVQRSDGGIKNEGETGL